MEKPIKFISLWFCLICILVFIVELIFPNFIKLFMLTPAATFRPWQFLTAIFLHANIVHLLYNLFALFFFGIILEKLIGSKNFTYLFLISGILANIISFYWYPNALGASGAIMALIGCLAVLRPMMTIWSFGVIMPMFVLAIVWVIGSIIGIFGFGDQSTGYLAHLSGLIIGLAYGFFLRIKKRKQQESSTLFTRKIIIPDNYIRVWEDHYMR